MPRMGPGVPRAPGPSCVSCRRVLGAAGVASALWSAPYTAHAQFMPRLSGATRSVGPDVPKACPQNPRRACPGEPDNGYMLCSVRGLTWAFRISRRTSSQVTEYYKSPPVTAILLRLCNTVELHCRSQEKQDSTRKNKFRTGPPGPTAAASKAMLVLP